MSGFDELERAVVSAERDIDACQTESLYGPSETLRTLAELVADIIAPGGPVVVTPDGTIHQATSWTIPNPHGLTGPYGPGRYIVAKVPADE